MTKRRRLLVTACTAAALGLSGRGAAALELPQTAISYRIEAELDPATRALKGTQEIRWRNVTGAPISALPLHLYLNAFSHEHTTWMQGAPAARFNLDALLSKEPDPWGHMEPVSIRQRGEGGDRDAAWRPIQPDDGNALDRSLAEVTLAEPVPPGGEVVLTIVFEGRLPAPIARTGGGRDYFLVAQWYPKIGVIEDKPAVGALPRPREARDARDAAAPRSAARQFHGPTEFYADFADYDVSFKVPSGWLVGATGRAQGEPTDDGARATAHYTQRAVHDFALVVGKGLTDVRSRHHQKGGGAVDVRYIVPAGTEHQVPRWRSAVEGALDVLGSRVGPYPYETLTVVTVPHWAAATAGMEYPTFITGLTGDPMWDTALLGDLRVAEGVLVHELGHQYFQGLLASNEPDEAFLDEGFNSYWEGESMRALHGEEASSGWLLGRAVNDLEMQSLGLDSVADRLREPMRKRPSWLFESGTWGVQIYARSAVTFATAARLFGQDTVDRTFAEYFRRFAFKHPDTDDFLEVAADAGGPGIAAFCREAFERERIPDYRVATVSSRSWQPPLGRVMTDAGPVEVTPERRATDSELGLPPEAREADGQVLVEITDPGWVRGGQSVTGAVTRSFVMPERGAAAVGYRPAGYHESTVIVEGPGWDTLPVTVEVRFADGAVMRDAWDGKAGWRQYRFVRAAPVVVARVDPAGKIALDVKPENNALARSADGGFVADWGLWLGAAAEWVAGGVSLWL